MIKLSDIVKEVLEGVKVTFDDSGEKATSIDIAYQHLDGEQLNTDDDFNKRYGYKVFYSLRSDPKATKIKKAEDALKYKANLIKSAELKNLLKKTIVTRLPKVDYIGFLESKGSLNLLLLNTFQDLYPGAETVEIKKVEYKFIDNAVDWDKFSKQTDSIKKTILKFLRTTAQKPGPYKIRKSDELQSLLVKLLHSKYNIGLHPSGEGEKFPPAYNIIVECLTKGKTMLIVDDNTHTGTDFYKIFEGIERIREGIVEANSKPTQEEQEVIARLEQLKKSPKVKTSTYLQKEIPKLEDEIKLYRSRIDILNRSANRSKDHFFGYALYVLDPGDIDR